MVLVGFHALSGLEEKDGGEDDDEDEEDNGTVPDEEIEKDSSWSLPSLDSRSGILFRINPIDLCF